LIGPARPAGSVSPFNAGRTPAPRRSRPALPDKHAVVAFGGLALCAEIGKSFLPLDASDSAVPRARGQTTDAAVQ
jgi:hypothetical protein